MIYLNMPAGNFYGWAVCGKNLLRELAKITDVRYIEEGFEQQLREPADQALVNKFKCNIGGQINGVVVHTLKPDFSPHCSLWGTKNIGYLFYEKEELSAEQIKNLSRYDVVLAGSRWGERIIRKHGILCGTLVQGVDSDTFKPRERDKDDSFVIFSGGKWEHRKGQDLAIRVVKEVSKKLPNIVLRYNWANIFNYDPAEREIKAALDGVNAQRIGIEAQKDIAELMADTDMGLFLNRCEGGTNLVLMEYLASGRSAVVREDTGQRDVVDPRYAFLVCGSDDCVVADACSSVEYAYYHLKELQTMGARAAKAMKDFSWAAMAKRLLFIAKNWEKNESTSD